MKRTIKRVFSLLLAVTIILSAGCGSGGDNNANNSNSNSSNNTAADKQSDGNQSNNGTSSGEKAMGRYIENENTSLQESLYARHNIVKLEDGSLVIWDTSAGKWVSADEGETWQDMTPDWYRKITTDHYVMDVKVSPDGTVGIIYATGIGESGEDTSQEDGTDDTDEGSKEESSEDSEKDSPEETQEEEGMELERDFDVSIHPKYLLVTPDGTQKELELPDGDSAYVYKIFFTDNNQLFATTLDDKIYEVDVENGSYEVFAEMEDMVFFVTGADNRLVCVNSSGITIFDLETKEIIEDKVLDEFITANLGARVDFVNDSSHTVIPILADDNILYLICDKGIYSHVIGGNAVEQMADGNLTSLGRPSYGLSGALLSENNSFLVLFNNGSLIHYVYDADTPTVPEIQMKAYSLVENIGLKQTISIYQSKNPDVYIQYDIGMGEDSAVTREDALKKLNTELVAGTGPDLMILDDMPIDSYIEKGILLDVSPYLNKAKEGGEYFENILGAFHTETGTYGVPTGYLLPVMMGDKSDIASITDLKMLADKVESLRQENSEGSIVGLSSEGDIIYKLLLTSAPSFITTNNQLDTEALTEFFTQCKRIWEAEQAGLTDAEKERIENDTVEWSTYMTLEEIRNYRLSIGGQILEYVTDKQKIGMGTVDGSFDFDTMTSAFKIKGKTDGTFISYSGQVPNVFIPQSVLGMNAKSAYADRAGEILQLMLADDRVAGYSGHAVNKKIWRDTMATNMTSDGSAYGGMAVTDSEGGSVALDIYPASQDDINKLENIADSVLTPYMRDSMLEDTVCESGKKILNGEKSIDEGVAEIKQKLAIYMGE